MQRLEAELPYRGRLVRNLVLLTLVTAGTVAGVFLVGAYRAVADVSARSIQATTERTNAELDAFFSPVRKNLLIAADWAADNDFAVTDFEALNHRFVPVLRRNPQISSMLYADTKGHEYLLLRDGDTWVNRLTDKAGRGQTTQWHRWNNNLELVESWQKELDYDSKTRPWYIGARSRDFGDMFWTKPYTFFTTKDPGITASTRFRVNDDERILALDVMLLDISHYTSQLAPSEHGGVAVLTPDGKMLGLPRNEAFESKDALKLNVLKDVGEMPDSTFSVGFFDSAKASAPEAFRFRVDDAIWWGGFQDYPLGDSRLIIGVVVPNSDYVQSIDTQRNLILVITAIAILLAILVGFVTAANFRRRIERAMAEVEKLGQYTLEERIGTGGMGEVYLASHAMLRRPTAIKLIKPDKHDPDMVERFEREVQQTCRLTHPNTIVIFDYGRTPEGIFYYAMEYLEGATLLDFLNTVGPVPLGRALHILEQCCESLREAHGIGLVHRDIKPGNIFLCERGGVRDTVKVLDFGLVKEIEHDETDAHVEAIHGTPGYMAPESISDPAVFGPEGDVYALGAVGYALATGDAAYDGDTAMGIFMRQISQDPAPPHIVNPSVDRDFSDLVMHCLQRDPAKRIASMDELLLRIRNCTSYGRWSVDDSNLWWDDHKTVFASHHGPETIDETALTVEIGSRTPASQREELAG